MNQVNNLIQFKNLTDEQKAGFDFEGYLYSSQGYELINWAIIVNAAFNPRHGNGAEAYRLVIEPDKWYAAINKSFEGIIQGCTIEGNAYSSLRPAKPSEIPKPKRVFKDGAHYAVMYKSDDEEDVAQYDTNNDQFDTVKFGTCTPEAFNWIGEELNIKWGES